MTEIMPVPRNLSFTVLPAGGLRHLLLFFACTRHHRDEKYGGPPKGAEKSDGIPPLFCFRRKK